MSDTLHRSFANLDLSIRGSDPATDDGRTVYGLCCPFDQIERVTDVTRDGVYTYDEVFRNGAFTQTIAERGDRVKFLLMHNKAIAPLGVARSLREDPAGLIGEFYIPNTNSGNEALELIRHGALDGLSVGIKPQDHIGDRASGGLVERTAVALLEVSAVAFPAYSAAVIAGVRHETSSSAPHQSIDVPHQDEAPHQGIQQPPVLLDPTLAIRRRLRLNLSEGRHDPRRDHRV